MEERCPSGRRKPALEPLPWPGNDELVRLVRAAAAHDEAAWARLIDRYDRLLRGVARGFGLSGADVDDVVQVTWTRLYSGIRSLQNPAAVGAWLATTTRRECLRLLQQRVHEHLSEDPLLGDRPHPEEPEARLVAAERSAVLADALAGLPERHRRLMVLLASDTDADYRRIAQLTAMPIGSIGPIRRRCLSRLAGDPRLRAIWAAGS
jgi:RNA polymerase sigma factor (sigma-70 family)